MPRSGNARIYRPLAPQPGDVCTCTHKYAQHTGGIGPCAQLDSYDQPCECPSMEVDACWSDREDELTEWDHSTFSGCRAREEGDAEPAPWGGAADAAAGSTNTENDVIEDRPEA